VVSVVIPNNFLEVENKNNLEELNRCAEKTTSPMHDLFSLCITYYQALPFSLSDKVVQL
jgi:hypothetical protein